MPEKLGMHVKHVLFRIQAGFLLARNFLRLLRMTYVKQMQLVKKMSFFHGRIDLHSLATTSGLALG